MPDTIETPSASTTSTTGTTEEITDFLSADAILGAEDIQYTVVDCPEWAGKVRLRSFTGDERAQFEDRLKKSRSRGAADGGAEGDDAAKAASSLGIREHALWLTGVNGRGERLFTDPKQMTALRKKNAAPLDRCFEAALTLAGMTKKEQEKIKQKLREDPFDGGSSE